MVLEHEIVKNPMGLIQFTMNKGEKIIAEAAAMVYIRGNIETETRMRKGGFFKITQSNGPRWRIIFCK